MRQTRIEFPVGNTSVEGVMCGPVSMNLRAPAAVVCHPHPLLGGNMDSEVVFEICKALASRGVASLRFNFRRNSRNRSMLVRDAAHDTICAFNVLRALDFVDRERCALAGYSFGASAALRALSNLESAKAIATIAPPVSELDYLSVCRDMRPKIVIFGDADKLVDANALRIAVERMPGPTKTILLEGANHAFIGYAETAADHIAEFLTKVLTS